MSSNNPAEDISAGMTKGVLEWTSDKIEEWISKFKDRKLAFIQEEKTINLVKEQYRSGERKFYKEYIEDSEILFLVEMGLTLRKLEANKEDDRLHNLRGKIFNKYKVKGLHVAEFVQNGILNRYIGILIDELISIEKLKEDIVEILGNIEKHVLFVKGENKVSDVIKKVTDITNSHSPTIFIISGVKSASKIVASSIEKLDILLIEYSRERISGDDREILFFKRRLPN